jgi:hypothetical protein
VIEETNEDENVDTFLAKERETLSQADLTSFDNVVKNQRKEDLIKVYDKIGENDENSHLESIIQLIKKEDENYQTPFHTE